MMWQELQKAGCMEYSPKAAMPPRRKMPRKSVMPHLVRPHARRLPGRRLMPSRRCQRGRGVEVGSVVIEHLSGIRGLVRRFRRFGPKPLHRDAQSDTEIHGVFQIKISVRLGASLGNSV